MTVPVTCDIELASGSMVGLGLEWPCLGHGQLPVSTAVSSCSCEQEAKVLSWAEAAPLGLTTRESGEGWRTA